MALIYTLLDEARRSSLKPEKIGVVTGQPCRNPRCITSTEQELDQIFVLTDEKNKTYRCLYCEGKANVTIITKRWD